MFNTDTWRVYAWIAITQDYGLPWNPKDGLYNDNLHSLSVSNPQLSFNMSNCHSNTPRRKKINTKNSSISILPYEALTKMSLRWSNIPYIRYVTFSVFIKCFALKDHSFCVYKCISYTCINEVRDRHRYMYALLLKLVQLFLKITGRFFLLK